MTQGNDPINVMLTSSSNMFSTGLTKREYFAAKAMQGFLSGSSVSIADGLLDNEMVASYAVGLADALINALNKQP